MLLTVPFAFLAAVKRDRAVDHVIRVVGMVLFVMPMFWLGLLLILLFGLELGCFPTGGYEHGLGGALRSLTLPAVTLGLGDGAVVFAVVAGEYDSYAGCGVRGGGAGAGVLGAAGVVSPCPAERVDFDGDVVGVTIGGLLSGLWWSKTCSRSRGWVRFLVSAVSARDFPTVQGLVVVRRCRV